MCAAPLKWFGGSERSECFQKHKVSQWDDLKVGWIPSKHIKGYGQIHHRMCIKRSEIRKTFNKENME